MEGKGINRINNYSVVFHIVIYQEKVKNTKMMFTWNPWNFPWVILFPFGFHLNFTMKSRFQ